MVKFFLLDYVIMEKQPSRRTPRSSQSTTKYKEYKERIQKKQKERIQKKQKKEQKKEQASFINQQLAGLIGNMNIQQVPSRLNGSSINNLSESLDLLNIKRQHKNNSSGNLHNVLKKKLKIQGGNKTKRRNNKRSRRSLKKR